MRNTKDWTVVNRFTKDGRVLKGCWLKNPAGETVAIITDGALAGQIAAAMSLTTTKQRVEFCAAKAGYQRNGSDNPVPN